jgi:methyl-accepting chemotaxis protein
VLLLSALASVPLLGLFILEEIGKAYQPVINLADYPIINFGFLVLLFVLVVVIVIVFISRINKAVTVTEQQAQHLQEAFTALNSTHNVSKNLSHELTSVSTEISVNSQQHAHNFNEQVAAINQVTASLSELTETANQIASRASASDQSVGKAVAVAKEVEESSKQAQLVVQEGREAINRTVYNMSRLSQRIEQLAQNLLQLTSQAKNVGNIVSIINSISDEIHLLALNASIEAGGASQMGASVQGERFAVIAQEVKNLADRSRESTNEIEQTTKEIIGAIAGAVLIAEESRKETAHASAQSAMAGKVIEVLYQTIERNAIGTDQILKAFDEFIAYTEEIHLATHQQQSATSQILTTMNTISQVSRENSLAVSQISEAINRVSQQAHQLNQTLEIARN